MMTTKESTRQEASTKPLFTQTHELANPMQYATVLEYPSSPESVSGVLVVGISHTTQKDVLLEVSLRKFLFHTTRSKSERIRSVNPVAADAKSVHSIRQNLQHESDGFLTSTQTLLRLFFPIPKCPIRETWHQRLR